ncbi:MAG: histone deacetylase [Candidatus Hydrogenedentes bacterium]|nr:histone deacetylase [Candidatus Hydrogenedentota bacterium]
MARTSLAYDERMLLHNTGPGHPERPQRLKSICDALAQAKINPPAISVRAATREDLLQVHSARHIETIQRTCENDLVYPDPDTPMMKSSWEASLLAAGSAISACEAVIDGEVDNAFCAVRPPGHHAEPDRAMGFCLFNNVAVAARWLQVARGIEKLAILDWDVHHGNGTQHAFYDDETVYYVSLHEHPHYPGTGLPHERGAGHTNLNIQMRPGSGPEEWLAAIDKQVLPELERFAPNFLLISCGFDAHQLDPLGAQRLEAETYAEMTHRVGHLAGGRIVSLLEGGYHLEALADSAVAHFRALAELS